VPAFRPVDRLPAWVERKLFVHNMAHAVAAYLGSAAGCRFVHQATALPPVRAPVIRAMEEAGEALARKHGFDRRELAAERRSLLRRFDNALLADTVTRVGRDPARKLRPDDRLVGAALTCLDHGVEPAGIARGIAAALRFEAPGDASAAEVRRVVAEQGPGRALLTFAGQRPDGELGRLVLAAWDALEAGEEPRRGAEE
jgi:mannitol-1-phosphate 5-dehydrogenase